MKTPGTKARRTLHLLTSATLTVAFALAVLLVAGSGRLHTGLLIGGAGPTDTVTPRVAPGTTDGPTPSRQPTATPVTVPTATPSPTPSSTPTRTPSPSPRSEPPRPHDSSAGLDARCRTGRVICVDKTTRTLRWVVDGRVRRTLDARFGGSATPTREGEFSVFAKSRDHVSSLYDTSMPFAMFFSGGQAVHYSPDFASVGYAGASHGCVNVRDRAGVEWLFDQVVVGDTVVVWRS